MIKLFNALPISSTTAIDRLDVYISDGVTKRYTLLNKTGLRLADTVYAGGTSYHRSTGTLTVDGNDFILSSAPPEGTIIIAPGINRAQWRAYDQDSITGEDNPNISIARLILADFEEIGVQRYIASPTKSGLEVSIVDKDEDNGASIAWISFAPENPDGTEGAYGSAGVALVLPAISGSGFLNGSASALDTSITVDDGTQFHEGVYIDVGYGTANSERVRVTGIAGNVLTITGLTVGHDDGESVFECGWPFYAKAIIPTGVSGGVSTALYDLGLDILMDIESR